MKMSVPVLILEIRSINKKVTIFEQTGTTFRTLEINYVIQAPVPMYLWTFETTSGFQYIIIQEVPVTGSTAGKCSYLENKHTNLKQESQKARRWIRTKDKSSSFSFEITRLLTLIKSHKNLND
jgi:hypothetical protein